MTYEINTTINTRQAADQLLAATSHQAGFRRMTYAVIPAAINERTIW